MRRLALLIPALLLACKPDSPAPPAPPPAPALTAAPAEAAVDHVDPNEIPEGTEKAFGLPIPRAMRVDARFDDAVRAHGEVPFDALAGYVGARVVAGRVDKGPAKTVFTSATLKSAPDRMLRVEIVGFADRTEILVRDVTQKPASDTVSPTDPWDKPGFDPKDRKADPSRFE